MLLKKIRFLKARNSDTICHMSASFGPKSTSRNVAILLSGHDGRSCSIFEQHWRIHGTEVLDRLAEEQPAAYFAGAVALAKVMRIELGKPGEFDRPKTPEEIIDKLEQRIGPQGRIIFENFVREMNRLEAEQQLEQQERQQEEERQQQEQRRQQQQQRQHHPVSPSGAAGDAVERALAVAERWRASGAGGR